MNFFKADFESSEAALVPTGGPCILILVKESAWSKVRRSLPVVTRPYTLKTPSAGASLKAQAKP